VIKGSISVVVFDSLKTGEYGIISFHDENSNGELDHNFLGLPMEDFGFSNNASVFLGPPAWEEILFRVKGDTTTIKIDID